MLDDDTVWEPAEKGTCETAGEGRFGVALKRGCFSQIVKEVMC